MKGVRAYGLGLAHEVVEVDAQPIRSWSPTSRDPLSTTTNTLGCLYNNFHSVFILLISNNDKSDYLAVSLQCRPQSQSFLRHILSSPNRHILLIGDPAKLLTL